MYEIRLRGHLDESWQARYSGLVRLENGDTQLTGYLPDQTALHGILKSIRDLNMTLISVIRLSPSETTHT